MVPPRGQGQVRGEFNRAVENQTRDVTSDKACVYLGIMQVELCFLYCVAEFLGGLRERDRFVWGREALGYESRWYLAGLWGTRSGLWGFCPWDEQRGRAGREASGRGRRRGKLLCVSFFWGNPCCVGLVRLSPGEFIFPGIKPLYEVGRHGEA